MKITKITLDRSFLANEINAQITRVSNMLRKSKNDLKQYKVQAIELGNYIIRLQSAEIMLSGIDGRYFLIFFFLSVKKIKDFFLSF